MTRIIRERAIEWLVTAALVGLLAWAGKVFTRGEIGVSTIWVANALLLGVILTAPRNRRTALLLAGFVGGVTASWLIDGPVIALVTSAFNLVEVWVGSFRQRDTEEAQDLTSKRTFLRFLGFAVVLGPLVSTIGHLLYFTVVHGAPNWQMSASTLVSHALGIATFTPVTMALRRDDFAVPIARGRGGELFLMLLIVSGVALVVFSQNRFPLLFLVFPAMLPMAMRGGFGGTALGVVVVAMIAVISTLAGNGPLGALAHGPQYQHFFVLQLFIAGLLLTMFPVVVVLAENRRAHRAQHASMLQLNLLAEHSTDVIVLTNVAGRRLYVSPAVRDVFGYSPEEFQGMTWRDVCHSEDRQRIHQEMRERAASGERVTTTYRALRKDGREIWVEAQVSTFQDEDFARLGDMLGSLGDARAEFEQGRVVTLRDISRRKRAEIALAQANARLEALVWQDALTGLANRRRFDETIAEEWDRCARAGQPLSVVMLDVDHFKAFNDAYGHQQGDHRLVEVGQAISAALFRPRDVAVRYGGEEFAVILPATAIDEAGLVAERIRQNVMALDSGTGARGLGRCTVSLGVAGAVPADHGSPADILKAADDALYTSKREGRNRTTLLQVTWPVNSSTTSARRRALHLHHELDLDAG